MNSQERFEDDLKLWIILIISILMSCVIFCSPPLDHDKEKREYQQWLNQNCKVEKDVSGGFIPRTTYKCNDGSIRKVNHF